MRMKLNYRLEDFYIPIMSKEKKDFDLTTVTTRGHNFFWFYSDLSLGFYYSVYTYAIYSCFLNLILILQAILMTICHIARDKILKK